MKIKKDGPIKGDLGCFVVLSLPSLFCTWATFDALGAQNQVFFGVLAIASWFWALYYLFIDRDIWR